MAPRAAAVVVEAPALTPTDVCSFSTAGTREAPPRACGRGPVVADWQMNGRHASSLCARHDAAAQANQARPMAQAFRDLAVWTRHPRIATLPGFG